VKHLVVFTGAGISQESGLKTFRDSDGLWEEFRIEDVATPEAWIANPSLVLEFYNQRRKQAMTAVPNNAHLILAQLEQYFKVTVITQNVDDLHERGGSTNVLHLHGSLTECRSCTTGEVFPILGDQLHLGDFCPKGGQLRPNIVWFGEDVPNMPKAQEIARTADIFLTVGTSLNVYPAAYLVHEVPERSKKYIVDPADVKVSRIKNLTFIKEKATTGVARVAQLLVPELISLL
jgi:NAD-dependent deacetylase